jgi:hypothetical protein
MPIFNRKLPRDVASDLNLNADESNLVEGFVDICEYLFCFPDAMSWRGKDKPTVTDKAGITRLASKYFEGYRRSDFPSKPATEPDEMVSVIMRIAYDYTDEECGQIKLQHQHAMCAENCVGNLLERYLDSKLRSRGWVWCCGEFVKAIDFIYKTEASNWQLLQIKNRNNSENSSSKSVRDGTQIEHWFRSFSTNTKKGRSSMTNWDNLPVSMQGYGLSEEGFKGFVAEYLQRHKA